MTRARKTLITAAALVLAALPTSAAAADELMLSNDGATWHTDLVGGMFGASRAWVPGESRTGQIYVRNSTTTAGELSLQLTGPDSSPLIHHLFVRARIGSEPWSATRELPYSSPLPIGTVAGGADRTVTVRLTLDPASKLAVESSTAPLGITFRLTQEHDPTSVIAAAGAPVLWPWALFGGVLAGSGAWLLAGLWPRRRWEETS